MRFFDKLRSVKPEKVSEPEQSQLVSSKLPELEQGQLLAILDKIKNLLLEINLTHIHRKFDLDMNH